MPRLFAMLLTLALTLPASAEDQAIAALFAERGVSGSLVLSTLRGGQTFVHNQPRASQRFTPASTFKILHTLIALQERVVSGKNAPFSWDGQVRSIAGWNRDQTLESAFRTSCVWCFQQLARQLDAPTYRRYLSAAGYGELHEPFVPTRFWLDGSLTISALEQVAFLQRLYQRRLPFSPAAFDTLSQIMRVEAPDGLRLWAKTGLGGAVAPQVGWYVGYLEGRDDVWFFATNLEIHQPQQLPLREELTLAALRLKGAFDQADNPASASRHFRSHP